MGGSVAVLAAVLGAAPLNYVLSLRTEGRTGTSATTTTSSGELASFVELDPAASLASHFPSLSIEGGYRPRLLYSLNVDHSPLTVLHQGNLGGNWLISKKTRLTFDESLSYGRNDFSPLIPNQGTTPLDPRLPKVLILAYFNSTSSVGVSHSLKGLELGGSAAYSISGGVDQLARSVLPISRNGTISGRLAYEVTRRDAFTSSALFGVSTFSNGGKTLVENAAVGWRHQLDRATQGDVSTGVSVTQSIRPGQPDAVTIGPSGALGVSHQVTVKRPHQLRASARVSYSAAVDPYGSGAYSRIEGTLGGDYSPIEWLGFTLRGTGARGISGPPELRNGLAQLEFTSRFNVEQHLAIVSGVRTAWLSIPGATQLQTGFPQLQTGFQWSAFVGLTIQQIGKF